MSDLKKPILLLFVLLAVLACWGLLAWFVAPPTQGNPVSVTVTPSSNVAYVPPQPPPTAADTVTAQQNDAFQFVVSYTDTGFEPRTLTIKAGQTVRFTNNSTRQLWVAASGDALYPSAQNGCGSSALDSCAALQPGYFWQFTFTQKGTWEFQNNLDKTLSGSITVE